MVRNTGSSTNIAPRSLPVCALTPTCGLYTYRQTAAHKSRPSPPSPLVPDHHGRARQGRRRLQVRPPSPGLLLLALPASPSPAYRLVRTGCRRPRAAAQEEETTKVKHVFFASLTCLSWLWPMADNSAQMWCTLSPRTRARARTSTLSSSTSLITSSRMATPCDCKTWLS